MDSKAARPQVEEVEEAGKLLIKMAQRKYFSDKIVKTKWQAKLNRR